MAKVVVPLEKFFLGIKQIEIVWGDETWLGMVALDHLQLGLTLTLGAQIGLSGEHSRSGVFKNSLSKVRLFGEGHADSG